MSHFVSVSSRVLNWMFLKPPAPAVLSRTRHTKDSNYFEFYQRFFSELFFIWYKLWHYSTLLLFGGKWSVHHPNMPHWSLHRILWGRFMHCTVTLFLLIIFYLKCYLWRLPTWKQRHPLCCPCLCWAGRFSSSSYLSLGLCGQFYLHCSSVKCKNKAASSSQFLFKRDSGRLFSLLSVVFSVKQGAL